MSEFECVYSPAKRRGPVPGKVGQSRKSEAASKKSANKRCIQATKPAAAANPSNNNNAAATDQPMPETTSVDISTEFNNFGTGEISLDQIDFTLQDFQQQTPQPMDIISSTADVTSQGPARRIKTDNNNIAAASKPSSAESVNTHKPLLSNESSDGNRLRSFYCLSVDELFGLPAIPSDEDYRRRNNIAVLPENHENALNSARFAEIALGAIVHNEVSLSMELCNATVHCLRECMEGGPVLAAYAFEVCRAYFLLGASRAFRGDMKRYFKYRRVCMTHLSKFDVSLCYFFTYK